MGNYNDLDDIISDAVDSAISGVTNAVNEAKNVIRNGETDYSKAFGALTGAFVDGATDVKKVSAALPYRLVLTGKQLNWRDSIMVESDAETFFACEPSKRNHLYRLISDHGRQEAIVTAERPHFMGRRGDLTAITICDKDFTFEIDWRKHGLLYQVEDLVIHSPKKREVYVRNSGVEVIAIQVRHGGAKIWYRDEKFASLAASIALAAFLNKRL